MLVHHALALGERHHVPVLIAAAQAIHGIKAEIFRVGDGRKETRRHRVGRPLQARLHFGLKLGRSRIETLGGRGFPRLAARFVQAEFDDRDVRVLEFKKVVKGELGKIELNLVELLEGIAEMDIDQVALVAELRVKSGARRRGGVVARQGLHRLRCDSFAIRGRRGMPGFPVEAKELMQQRGAFKGERNRREIGQGKHLFADLFIVAKCAGSFETLQGLRSLSRLAAAVRAGAYCSPHAFIAIRMGLSARPLGVSRYSGRGGWCA